MTKSAKMTNDNWIAILAVSISKSYQVDTSKILRYNER